MLRACCVVFLGIAGLSLSRATAAPESEHQKINVGMQLYSLRAQFAKNGGATFQTVERWGITDVEAAGFYDQAHMGRVFQRVSGRPPGRFRAVTDSLVAMAG